MTKSHNRAWDLPSDQLLFWALLSLPEMEPPKTIRVNKNVASEKIWSKCDPDFTARSLLFCPTLQMLPWLYEMLLSNRQSKQGNLSKCPDFMYFFSFSKVRKETPYVLLNSWQKSARKIQCKYVSVLMKHKALRQSLYNPSKYILHEQTHVPNDWLERRWHRIVERNWSMNLIN